MERLWQRVASVVNLVLSKHQATVLPLESCLLLLLIRDMVSEARVLHTVLQLQSLLKSILLTVVACREQSLLASQAQLMALWPPPLPLSLPALLTLPWASHRLPHHHHQHQQ